MNKERMFAGKARAAEALSFGAKTIRESNYWWRRAQALWKRARESSGKEKADGLG